MKALTGFFVMLFIFLFVHAKNPAPEINTQINYGDKVSSFRIYERSGVQYFSFNDSYGKTSDGQLSKSGYEFIVKKVNETLALDSNDIAYCRRQFISVKAVKNGKAVEKKSCIGSATKVAKRMADLANTLQLLL